MRPMGRSVFLRLFNCLDSIGGPHLFIFSHVPEHVFETARLDEDIF